MGYSTKPRWVFGNENLRCIEATKSFAMREPKIDHPLGVISTAPNPLRSGHSVVCALLNAFCPVLYLWGDKAIEGPNPDLAYGLRPVLYHLLRREYLLAGGIAVCGHRDCRKVFELERSGQHFCSAKCSQYQRQREYWAKRGKKLRGQRQKRKLAGRKTTALKGR